MFVLDTNILSAIISTRPVPEAGAWIAGQPDELLFTATICQAEILSGIAILPDGRRRDIDGRAGNVCRCFWRTGPVLDPLAQRYTSPQHLHDIVALPS